MSKKNNKEINVESSEESDFEPISSSTENVDLSEEEEIEFKEEEAQEQPEEVAEGEATEEVAEGEISDEIPEDKPWLKHIPPIHRRKILMKMNCGRMRQMGHHGKFRAHHRSHHGRIGGKIRGRCHYKQKGQTYKHHKKGPFGFISKVMTNFKHKSKKCPVVK